MVLISYITTLAANEKFFFKVGGIEKVIGFLFVFIILIGGNSSQGQNGIIGFIGSPLTELFAAGACLPYLLCVLLLLIVLIGVVKMVKLEEGPIVKRL